ncbi:MAG TPA: hypothetical protein DDY77_02175 [Clostridiales bacterium]|nr:hypothetical protein [Clostridiales bacterium]
MSFRGFFVFCKLFCTNIQKVFVLKCTNIQNVFGSVCTNIQKVFSLKCTNIQNVESSLKSKNHKNANKIKDF